MIATPDEMRASGRTFGRDFGRALCASIASRDSHTQEELDEKTNLVLIHLAGWHEEFRKAGCSEAELAHWRAGMFEAFVDELRTAHLASLAGGIAN